MNLDSLSKELNLEYAMIVGKTNDGNRVAAFFGEPDDFQIIGMARYLYEVTKTSTESLVEEEFNLDIDTNIDEDDEDW